MSLRPPKNTALYQANNILDPLQHEIMQEKASTLGRLTRDFEKALAALLEFDAARVSGADPHAAARRESLLDAAADALWWFVVQREACGLRNTEAVLREYRVPAAVRLRMGVVRRR
jgi:hypothetical protein